MNLALIVAAGKGTRMGREGGKQFLSLLDKPVIAHTLISFQKAASIDAIIVVTADENYDKCLAVIDRYGITKADRIVIGGDQRQDSVYNGLMAAREFEKADYIVVHDGARSLIEPGLIDKAVGSAVDCDGVIVGIPAKDTVKIVHDGYVTDTLDRTKVWQIQTPQVFHFDTLLSAHEKARAGEIYGTDDAMLVEMNGGRVKVIEGSEENIKITTPFDLVIAEAILKARRERGRVDGA